MPILGENEKKKGADRELLLLLRCLTKKETEVEERKLVRYIE